MTTFSSVLLTLYSGSRYPVPALNLLSSSFCRLPGEVFDYLVAHGRMKEKEARAKFRQVCWVENGFFPLLSQKLVQLCKRRMFQASLY